MKYHFLGFFFQNKKMWELILKGLMVLRQVFLLFLRLSVASRPDHVLLW